MGRERHARAGPTRNAEGVETQLAAAGHADDLRIGSLLSGASASLGFLRRTTMESVSRLALGVETFGDTLDDL